MRKNFANEIEHLLSEVPSEQWQDPGVCGLMHELLPWHKMSSVTVQTREDDPHDPAAWKYYFSAESDTSRINREIERYLKNRNRFVYHDLLIEAAKALLSIDFTRYGRANTIEDGCLYGPFRLQIYDVDQTFSFNYCEYVLARRLGRR